MHEMQSLDDGSAIANSQQYTLQQLQSCIFETPPSILASPDLSSSSLFAVGSASLNCCTHCRREGTTLSNSYHSKCPHKYCEDCLVLIGVGCPMCSLASLRLSPTQLTCDMLPESSKTIPRLDFSIWSSNPTVWDSRASVPFDSSTASLQLEVSDGSGLFSSPSPVAARTLCASCGEGSQATHFCVECKDLLCGACVDAHSRVRLTKEHHVESLTALNTPLSAVAAAAQAAAASSHHSPPHNNTPTHRANVASLLSAVEEAKRVSSLTAASLCPRHEVKVIGTCEWCKNVALCTQCIHEHAAHKIVPLDDVRYSISALCADSREEVMKLEESLDGIARMQERVDTSVQAVGSEIRSVIHMHISACEERKRELLALLEMIRVSKMGALKAQCEALALNKSRLQEMVALNESTKSEDDVTKLTAAFDQIVKMHTIPRIARQPNETDSIKFNHPDPNLLTKMRQLGSLESAPCARNTTIVGEGYKRAVKERLTTVTIQMRDACNQVCRVRGQQLTGTVLDPSMNPLDVCLSEKENGVCVLSYTPLQEGKHILNVAIRGISIKGCPAEVDTRRGRNYEELGSSGELFSFGREGSGDGELCRPWGICCDLLGRILVADRSNNRVQIFNKDGHFISKFGTSGTRAGQFDRPAGITTNTLNQIIVADKDNHRVQVFDQDGNFVTKFGERGRPVGMFNYPWGVATNGLNHIAVSDTRNHRVQIFTSMGQFIRKCGFDSAYFYKHLDSPRGLCYLPDGQLLITDFNNHRLAILSSNRSSPEMQCYGGEGEADGMFCRPQGVKTDAEGNILVCDSRNNRVQILSGDDMRCVSSFGGAPKVNGFQMPQELPTPLAVGGATNAPPPLFAPQPPKALLDRPTDVCVTPEGRIYVVDFGNNCIRVF